MLGFWNRVLTGVERIDENLVYPFNKPGHVTECHGTDGQKITRLRVISHGRIQQEHGHTNETFV